MTLLRVYGPAAALGILPPPVEEPAFSAAQMRVGQARAALGRGDLAMALRLFEDAIALDGDLGIAHLGRVACLVALDREDDAALAIDESMHVPAQEGVTAHLARGFANRGETRVAMQLVGAILKDAPEAAPRLAEDSGLRRLNDDPRFLQMVGRL